VKSTIQKMIQFGCADRALWLVFPSLGPERESLFLRACGNIISRIVPTVFLGNV